MYYICINLNDMEIKKGMLLRAIDPCTMDMGEDALVVGDVYEILDVLLDKKRFVVSSRLNDEHMFSFDNIHLYFEPVAVADEPVTAVQWLVRNLKHQFQIIGDDESLSALIDYALEMEQKQMVRFDKITRLEVINHAENKYTVGRVITLYKELGFDSLDFSFQDKGMTLKIFVD